MTICHTFKLPAKDGKLRDADCASTKNAFRLIQSIPSPKAEPFKLWLAQVGYERIQEIENPELTQNRVKQYYELKGYPKEILIYHLPEKYGGGTMWVFGEEYNPKKQLILREGKAMGWKTIGKTRNLKIADHDKEVLEKIKDKF